MEHFTLSLSKGLFFGAQNKLLVDQRAGTLPTLWIRYLVVRVSLTNLLFVASWHRIVKLVNRVYSEAAMKKIVTIGGGTGTFTVLSGLKKYPFELTAVVTMSDNGGSSGRLRDEYGVLPPGDVRQCLVALSESSATMRKLFNHRYEKGDLSGHSFGNIFISTLEHITGSLDKALDMAGEILNIRGRVVPVTLSKAHLMTELKNGKVFQGQKDMSNYQLVSRFGIKRIWLHPKPKPNPKALSAIEGADLIILGPGNLYASLVPNLLVPGIGKAIINAKAKKVLVTNLINPHGQTDGLMVNDYVRVLETFVGKSGVFDAVIFNTKRPSKKLVEQYASEGALVERGDEKDLPLQYVGANILSERLPKKSKTDTVARALIRHDADKLARVIADLI